LIPLDDRPSIAKTMDLVMLVMTDGGRERTEQEFRELFARAGLRLSRVVPTKVDNCILEVEPENGAPRNRYDEEPRSTSHAARRPAQYPQT